jgi:hypothetical protein
VEQSSQFTTKAAARQYIDLSVGLDLLPIHPTHRLPDSLPPGCLPADPQSALFAPRYSAPHRPPAPQFAQSTRSRSRHPPRVFPFDRGPRLPGQRWRTSRETVGLQSLTLRNLDLANNYKPWMRVFWKCEDWIEPEMNSMCRFIRRREGEEQRNRAEVKRLFALRHLISSSCDLKLLKLDFHFYSKLFLIVFLVVE